MKVINSFFQCTLLGLHTHLIVKLTCFRVPSMIFTVTTTRVNTANLGVTSGLIKVFIIFLQATNQCTEFQFLVLYADGTTSCVDCESCPPGQGLSPECGTKISSSEMVHCMPCIQGSSFTTSYDTSSCIPCSAPCSEDQLVNQTCTTTSDVKCAKQCYSKDRYYSCKVIK